VVLWLAGCVQVPRIQEEGRYRLPDCRDWHVSGRIGVVRDGEGWHGGFDWRQTGGRFRVSLRGPLGQGGLLLLGEEGRVRMVPSEGMPLEGRDIDALVARALGWPVPVSGLQYWILARAASDREATVERDARGRPVRIVQDGWRLEYAGWERGPSGFWWPTRLRGVRDGLRVKLVLRRHECLLSH